MNKFAERLTYYQELFGLKNWNIRLQQASLEDKNHSAMTLADPRYHTASMTVYPQALVNESAFDSIIIHELIHVVMALYDFFADNIGGEKMDELFFIAREKSVSELTSIMIRILKEGDTT